MIFNFPARLICRLTGIVFFIVLLHCIEKPFDVNYSGNDQSTYVSPIQFDNVVFDSSGFLWGTSDSFLYMMKMNNNTAVKMDSIPVTSYVAHMVSSGDGRVYILFSTFLMLVGRDDDSIKIFENTEREYGDVSFQSAIAGKNPGELWLFDIKHNAILNYGKGVFSTAMILDKGYGYSTKLHLYDDTLYALSVPAAQDSSILYTFDVKKSALSKKKVYIPVQDMGLTTVLYHKGFSLRLMIRISSPVEVKIANEDRTATISDGYALGFIENGQFVLDMFLRNYMYVNYLYDSKNDISWFVADNYILRDDNTSYYQLLPNKSNYWTPISIYNGALYWYYWQTSKIIRLDTQKGFVEVVPDYDRNLYSVNGVINF